MCNSADDTTFHDCDSDVKDLITRLEHDSLLAIECFQANYMKLNEGKFHLLISGHKQELSWPNIRRSEIWESEKQKPFGIVIDRNKPFGIVIYVLMDMFCHSAKKLPES